MPSNPFVEQRKAMKIQLMKFMRGNQGMEEKRIVALFSMKTGLRTETIRSYLTEIKDAMELEIIQESD